MCCEPLEDRCLLAIAFPQPVEAQDPLGSLIYDSSVSASIAAAGEIDDFTIALDDGQTVTVVVDPDPLAALQPTIELLDPGSVSLGTATAGAAGQDAVLQTVPTTGPGTYTVNVGGAGGTTGSYTVTLVLNAAVEEEEHDGSANHDISSAQVLPEAAFLALGSGPADRAGVLGAADGSPDVAGPDGFGYDAMAVAYEFEDISSSGTAVLSYADDGYAELTDTDLDGFAFDFYGTTYTSLFVSSNGLITFGSAESTYANTPLGGSPSAAAIAPMWDDLDTRGMDAVYWEVRGSGSDQRLIVQWNEIKYYDGLYDNPEADPITFQAVLYEADGLIQFNYADLTGGYEFQTEAASATVGIKGAGPQGDQRLLLSYNAGPNVFVGSGRSTLVGVGIAPPVTPDFYQFDVDGGDFVTLALTGLTPGPLQLALYDDSLAQVAMGTSAVNVDRVIGNFLAGDAGTYYARVLGRASDYSLVVARNADFDTEPNSELAEAQQLSETGVVVGSLISKTISLPGPGGSQQAAASTGGGDADSQTPAPDDVDNLWDVGSGSVGNDAGAGDLPARLIVRFADSATRAGKSRALATQGGKVVRRLPLIDGAVIELPDASIDVRQAAKLWSADPSVLYAEPDYPVHVLETFPNDPSFGDLWGLHNTGQTGGLPDADIDAPEAWDLLTGSSTVVVASIDTGVDYTHPDLAANMWRNMAEYNGTAGVDDDGNGYVDDIYGIDPANGDSDPMDDHGHGTHTSGTIGAVGNNGVGVTGVNWNVQIMALKFLSADGVGYTSDAVTAVEYMTTMKTTYGVNLVASNNSWGGGGYSKALEDAIIASNEAGIMFVAAAGNISNNNDVNPSYPASYEMDGVIAVAATDHNDVLASFSSFGAASVDLGAPGVDILSTLPGSQFGANSGTSMATPHVAGAVALLAAYNPEATLDELKTAILEGADPVPDLAGITLTGGRLNLANSLALISDPGDFYQVEVNVGDTLAITTSTPADGPYQFENVLDPAIELYDPAGVLVASDDNSGADGRNAELTHVATTSGAYVVRVLSAAGRGEYVLEVSGHTGPPPAFQVDHTLPAHGDRLSIVPTTLTVDFNDAVLVTSLAGGDLTVGGMPATGFAVVDGDTVVFSLPSLSEGTYDVVIAAGAILDVQRTPIQAFWSQFTVDLTAPRVIATSIQEGDVLPVGDLAYTVQFDEELNAEALDASDVQLVGVIGGAHVPAALAYDPPTSTLTAQFADLPDDSYTLTLLSDDGAFEDIAGNDLDGEPIAFPIPPNQSGDGVPGGRFIVQFALDAAQIDANAFERLEPMGGLMFGSPGNRALISSPSDEDGFVFFAERGRTVAAYVVPDEPDATMTIEMAGVSVRPIASPDAGEAAFLPPTLTGSDRTYEIRVSADVPTTYELWIASGAAVEVPGNDSAEGNELPIDDSRIGLGAGRFGVLGSSHAPEGEAVVWGVQPATGRILLIDPATGELRHEFPAPDGLLPDHTQIGLTIAEDGQSLLYVNSDVDPSKLYRLNPVTGAVLSTETTDGLSYDGLGIRSYPLVPTPIYSADMDTNPGWTLEGDWQWGVPTGGGSYGGDPTSGFTGTNVIGYNLDGDYPNYLSVKYATTPPIDASGYTNVQLSFYRWLGIGMDIWDMFWDQATIEVSNDGTNWTTIWDNLTDAPLGVFDDAWVYQSFDISSVADGQPSVYVRWSMGPTGETGTYPGWNIDDVLVTGTAAQPPTIFLNHDHVEVRSQDGYSGAESGHLTSVLPSGALGGDDTDRQFVYVPGTGIVEFDPDVPETLLNTLPEPEAALEGLAFDGTNLYAAGGSGSLYTLDPDTGAVLSTVYIPGGSLFGLGAITLGVDEDTIIFAEDFDEPTHGFTFDNSFGSGSANHTPPGSIYFGQGEGDAGGGSYDTGAAVGGVAVSPEIALPDTVPITLSFHSLIYVEEPFEFLRLSIDDGASRTPLMGTWEASLPYDTGGLWRTFTADLSGFAGRDVRLRFWFDTWDNESNFFEGWYVDDVRIVQKTDDFVFSLPDVDEYTIDLTGKAGQAIDVVLAGQESANFSSAVLELLDTDGRTVLATATPDPLGIPAPNYDLAVLDFLVPHDGVYTLRFNSSVRGEYGIVVTDSAVFDSEPHDEPTYPLRSLDDRKVALGYVGLTGGNRLFAAEWADTMQRGTIYELDPQTGEVLNSFETPNLPNASAYGINLAFDGENLWYNAGREDGDNRVYKLDPDDGSVLDSFYDPEVGLFIGLAYAGGELFACDMGTVYVYDVTDPTYPRDRFFYAPDYLPTGFAGNDAAGTLYMLSQNLMVPTPGSTIYEIDAETGSVIRSEPAASIYSEEGAAVVGEELFISEAGYFGGPNEIAVYDLQTLAPVRRIEVEFNTLIAGLGGDGYAGDTGDRYQVQLAAGQTLRVHTETPLDHPADPLNDLDPKLVLYNPSGAPVAGDNNGFDGKNAHIVYTATTPGAYEIEVAAESGAGEYLLKVAGQAVYIDGTSGDDTIIFETDGLIHRIKVNGNQYAIDNASEIHVDALGGNDSIRIFGTPQSETATFQPGSVGLVGPNYQVYASSVEVARVYAGGGANEQARLAGSAGDDTFYGRQPYSYLKGTGFFSYASGFDYLQADATVAGAAGRDRAYLYDSAGSDTFYGGPDSGRIVLSTAVDNEAIGFDIVKAYATAGGADDHAYLTGSATDDTFYNYETYSYLSGGGVFYNYAWGFDYVEADATDGGAASRDRAYLYDSDSPADDTFYGHPDHARIDRSSTGAVDGKAIGFDIVRGYALGGGANDRALLVGSDGDDRFYSYETYSYLKGADFYNYAWGFGYVEADVTSGSAGGGDDRAYLYDSDSPANDTFYGAQDAARMVLQSGVEHKAIAFDTVKAFAAGGGYDEAFLTGSAGDDRFYGWRTHSYLKGAAFYNYVQGFDHVDADVTAGGETGFDRAYLYDSGDDEVFVGQTTYGDFSYAGGVSIRAHSFDYGRAVAEEHDDNDTADLYPDTIWQAIGDWENTNYPAPGEAGVPRPDLQFARWIAEWKDAEQTSLDGGDAEEVDRASADYLFMLFGGNPPAQRAV